MPSRKRLISEARAVIGWLSRQLGTDSTKDVAAYFQRESSTFSRHIGKIDAKAKHSDQFRDRLNRYIKGRGKNKLSRILCLLWARVVKILPMTNPRKNRM